MVTVSGPLIPQLYSQRPTCALKVPWAPISVARLLAGCWFYKGVSGTGIWMNVGRTRVDCDKGSQRSRLKLADLNIPIAREWRQKYDGNSTQLHIAMAALQRLYSPPPSRCPFDHNSRRREPLPLFAAALGWDSVQCNKNNEVIALYEHCLHGDRPLASCPPPQSHWIKTGWTKLRPCSCTEAMDRTATPVMMLSKTRGSIMHMMNCRGTGESASRVGGDATQQE